MIHHVTREIPEADLDACLAFYGMLGFTPVQPPEGIRGRAAWLASGGTQLHLLFTPDAVPARGHIAVLARDYDAVLSRLSDAGYTAEPRRPHWGSPRCYVRDPAGNLVELMASAPDG